LPPSIYAVAVTARTATTARFSGDHIASQLVRFRLFHLAFAGRHHLRGIDLGQRLPGYEERLKLCRQPINAGGVTLDFGLQKFDLILEGFDERRAKKSEVPIILAITRRQDRSPAAATFF